ncbi:nuclear transport factor 2 family protein [Methanobrevibacter sp.]|uniref:nuclear transport factor 2 family protein n=1 Tax=Methanobrevibacter sp. TaxID=66852 RepID=UPI0025F36EC1|nr:nuclear transport factor 2 family protein [Methanobrevibacter sp.]MBR4447248.1 nuclear transport factor 2 family protein [Methanobrevibacter sp.]
MSDVELLCEKSFSFADQEIVDKFVEFQYALIEADIDKLDEILLDDFKLTQAPNKSQVKREFISEIKDGSMDFSKSDIMEPTILLDDDASASLISKVRLTAKVKGKELRWISNTVANFKKIDEIWYLIGWDN